MSVVKGAAVTIGPQTGPAAPGPVVVGVRWEAPGTEADLFALLCDGDHQVLDDDHFLFFNAPRLLSAGASALLLESSSVNGRRDRAQWVAHLGDLPQTVVRVVLILAVLEEGCSFAQVSGVRAVLENLETGHVLADFLIEERLMTEKCVVLCEIYRHQQSWKFRAVGQGYGDSLAGLAKRYGVDVE